MQHVCPCAAAASHARVAWGMQVEHAQGPSAEDIQEILPRLSPKQLADAIWGFAKQGHKPTDDFMAVVVQEVHSKLDQFRCANHMGAGQRVKHPSAYHGGNMRAAKAHLSTHLRREAAGMY